MKITCPREVQESILLIQIQRAVWVVFKSMHGDQMTIERAPGVCFGRMSWVGFLNHFSSSYRECSEELLGLLCNGVRRLGGE